MEILIWAFIGGIFGAVLMDVTETYAAKFGITSGINIKNHRGQTTVSRSLQNLERLQRDRFDSLTKHDHFPFSSAVAGFGEFKTIGAAQDTASIVVARQCESGAGDGVIQKLQVFSGTGASACFTREFEDADAVQPIPAECDEQHQCEQAPDIHLCSRSKK